MTDIPIASVQKTFTRWMENSNANYGTFQDSLRAPIHRWFTYPAGFSHKLVDAKVSEHNIVPGHCIGDPFVGSGTTCLSAKLLGVDSLGVEAHPFVFKIAKTKLAYEYDIDRLIEQATTIRDLASRFYQDKPAKVHWPELVHKCFTQDNLERLAALRTAVMLQRHEQRSFFEVALTATLRDSTSAGAGWPYIAPSKFAARKVHHDAFIEFEKRCDLMVRDIEEIQSTQRPPSKHKLIEGDAREFKEYTPDQSIDMVLTSPPYLNNYDYADRTRLETYFWGLYDSWSSITKNVRDRLIVAATTQVRRARMMSITKLPNVAIVSPSVYEELRPTVRKLSYLRKEKAGKKSYDVMVAHYFEDMLKVMTQVYSTLKPSSPFILVLGDSAPYGVHVPTDELICQLAIDIGFSDCTIEVLRTRGDKWAANPQRHKVPLRESIVTLLK